jgi:MFS transporter, FHS family, glucose/mannose:H+ symporter
VTPRGPTAAGSVAFALLGWNSPLIPSLVASIEHEYGQSDAGIGLLYLIQSIAFIVGATAGGFATERFGRRGILIAAFVAQGLGLGVLSIGGAWPAFVAGAALRAVGAGATEGGVQGLVLDVSGTAVTRDMNLLHVSWSAGAFAAPLGVAMVVAAGAPWQSAFALSALASAAVAIVFGRLPMPPGRRPATRPRPRVTLHAGLLLMAAAIALYVAAESGVGSWAPRFFSPSPLIVSSLALSLFWGGLTVGRLLAATIANGADPPRLVVLGSGGGALALAAAVQSPSPVLSVVCFGAAGVAFGPLYPLIIVAGGRLVPGRAAAVSGSLSAAAVLGAVVYPPLMGSISDRGGIGAAMLGASVVVAASGALALAGSGGFSRQRR